MNRYTVKRSDIMAMATEGRKISLIKEYRSCTGLGLRESKDAIEKFVSKKHPDDMVSVYDVDGLLTLFSPYVTHDIASTKILINQGVSCVLDNYNVLGFENPFDAVRMVINNIEAIAS
jgi:hypothetical protein